MFTVRRLLGFIEVRLLMEVPMASIHFAERSTLTFGLLKRPQSGRRDLCRRPAPTDATRIGERRAARVFREFQALCVSTMPCARS